MHQMVSMLVAGSKDLPEIGFSNFILLDAINEETQLPSPDKPRVLTSHFLFRFLPRDVVEKKVKVVFFTRNLKDVFVSLFCYLQNVELPIGYPGTWPQFLSLLLKDGHYYGNAFDFLRDWEKEMESLPEHPIYHCSYEDTKQKAALVVVVTVVAMKVTSALRRCRYKLPPGPWGLPLVGYIPFLGPAPFITFNDLRQRYGDVFSITMGSKMAVVINGYDVIKEALTRKGSDFSGRPVTTQGSIYNGGTSMVFTGYDPAWKAHQRVVKNVLYNLKCSSGNCYESIVRSEVDIMIEEFLAQEKRGFFPRSSLKLCVCSVMYQLCYGSRDNVREDENFVRTIQGADKFQEFSKIGAMIDAMPCLRLLLAGKIQDFRRYLETFSCLFDKQMELHEDTFHEDHLRDITDSLIYIGNRLPVEDKEKGLGKKQVVNSVQDIFLAGSDTTSGILLWCLQFLVIYPDFQEKIFDQIQQVVGSGRQPSLDDRQELPLVEAFVWEVVRFGTLVNAIPHNTVCDTTLRGYDIPKNTMVLVNLYSVYVDEGLWGDPKEFRPERFITDSGRLDKGVVEQVVAFSLGQRRCVGELLARKGLFLLLATIVQRVRFEKPSGHPPYSLDSCWDLMRSLKHFDLTVHVRD